MLVLLSSSVLSSGTSVIPSGPVALGTAVFTISAGLSICAWLIARVAVHVAFAPTASAAIGQFVNVPASISGSTIVRLVKPTLPVLVNKKLYVIVPGALIVGVSDDFFIVYFGDVLTPVLVLLSTGESSSITGVVPSGAVAEGVAVFVKVVPASICACVMVRVALQFAVAPTANEAIGQPVSVPASIFVSATVKLLSVTLPVFSNAKV